MGPEDCKLPEGRGHINCRPHHIHHFILTNPKITQMLRYQNLFLNLEQFQNLVQFPIGSIKVIY